MIVTEYIYTRIQVCEQQKIHNYHMYAKYIERFHLTSRRPFWRSKTTETMTLEIELLIYAETFSFVTRSLYRKKSLFNQAFLIYVDCNGQDEVELLLGFELH